jgi:Protein of unknown function DUF262/Putative DNA-binding domain
MADLGSQTSSIQSVYSLYRDDKLYVNRRYQRKLVWTLEEKQKLIESVLKKYPVPALLIAEREEVPGSFEIIDGLQRLHAIVSFVETSFPTLDGKIFDIKQFPTAKSRADEGLFVPTTDVPELSQRDISVILDYTLSLSVMRNATDAEINDVFSRINTYGHRLSDQERRQAGVRNAFSTAVREIACTLRGDASAEILLLKSMPSISIDLPMSKHGYEVQAEDVFWVNHGILRSTDLRDSMDEQCIADIAACIVGGDLIERSKDALDEIYIDGSPESDRIVNALGIYGSEKFSDEMKFCINEILNACVAGRTDKLRDIIFLKRTTNAFPSVFAIIVIAFHELIVREGKKVVDYAELKDALNNITARIEIGRQATSVLERRRNVDAVKGVIGACFAAADNKERIYAHHSTIDIEAIIRRSEVELADYELKQGLVTLGDRRTEDKSIIDKVIKTICAIANNGRDRSGKLLIGVADDEADASRIRQIDKIEPKKVGRKFVVGVEREARVLGLSVEQYFTKWRDGIKSSALSQPLRDSVLSNMDYNSFYGLGVIVITIPSQRELAYVGDNVYWREGSSTECATKAPQIARLARRF